MWWARAPAAAGQGCACRVGRVPKGGRSRYIWRWILCEALAERSCISRGFSRGSLETGWRGGPYRGAEVARHNRCIRLL